ncbi:transporter [Gemmobacter serpentinus]|uniref:transporter n=1 Tax=Gemmobacter serpentinus TaxID=2652247 RepID=UPI00384D4FE3
MAGTAQAIDVGPADYTILPSGTTLGMFYWQHMSSDTLSIGGTEVPGSSFKADVVILRSLNYFQIGQTPAAFHIVAPYGEIGNARIGGADQPTRSGIGDVTVGLTAWPVQPSNPETGTTLGFSLFATLPTGDFAPGSIGIAEGTTTITPQVGIIQGLGDGWYFDGVLDVAIQADHDEGGVTHERDPAWQLQTMLRKQWGPETSLTIGYSGQRGGDQIVGGVKTGLKTHRDQIRLYGTHFLTPTLQVQGMLAKDLNVEGGFKYNSVAQIRLVKVF